MWSGWPAGIFGALFVKQVLTSAQTYFRGTCGAFPFFLEFSRAVVGSRTSQHQVRCAARAPLRGTCDLAPTMPRASRSSCLLPFLHSWCSFGSSGLSLSITERHVHSLCWGGPEFSKYTPRKGYTSTSHGLPFGPEAGQFPGCALRPPRFQARAFPPLRNDNLCCPGAPRLGDMASFKSLKFASPLLFP